MVNQSLKYLLKEYLREYECVTRDVIIAEIITKVNIRIIYYLVILKAVREQALLCVLTKKIKEKNINLF
jgi:hypothetical protein